MNTKYKATAHLSSDSYNKFTAQTLSEIYNLLKDCIPFDSCKCTFTYCSNNTTVSVDINDIPKNLNVKTFEFFAFDFSKNDDYITASFTPDSISVTVCLPIDFKSSEALAENILKRLHKYIPNHPNDVVDGTTNVKSCNNKKYHKSTHFCIVLGSVLRTFFKIVVTAVVESIVKVFFKH